MYGLNELGEHQSKIILERINHTEKNMGHLVEAFAAFIRKEARCRDKTDELAKTMKTVSEVEHFNDSTSKVLDHISTALVVMADHKSLEIQRVEEKIISELQEYESICRNARDELKNQIFNRDKELTKRRQLEINLRIPRRKGSAETNDILTSNMQISNILKEISTIGEQFEMQKIADIKECLENFILIQMKQHVAALEVLSAINISSIEPEQDVEQFKKHLQQSDRPNSGFRISRFRSQSLGALSSMFSQSTSNLDKIHKRKKEATSRRNFKTFSQSSISLNSLDSDEGTQVRKENIPVELSAESIDTNSVDEDTDDESASHSDKPTKLPANKMPTRHHVNRLK